MHFKRKSSRTVAATTRRVAIDMLESRRLLATINGTSGNDTIEISATASDTRVRVNGGVLQITTDAEVNIFAGAGNDTFRVLGTRSFVIVRAMGEAGDDTAVNPVTLDLDAVYRGPMFFIGGTGTDTYVADNGQDATTPVNIDITRTGITKSGHGAISLYDDIEFLEYWDSNGSNRIGFTGLRGPSHDLVNLAIHGNAGNDTITNTDSVAPLTGVWDTSIGTGGVLVDGGTGTDTLRLNNAGDTASGRSFSFDSSAIDAIGNAGPLTYSTCEAIDFLGSPGNDGVTLLSKPPGTSLRYDSGDGADTFNFAAGDLDSTGWRATTLVAGGGSDRVSFFDALDTDAAGESETYNFDNQSLAKGTMVITYSGVEQQSLAAANGTVPGLNTVPVINLNATNSLIQSTTISGGAARGCTVNVGNGSFANLFGTFHVALNGGFFDRVTASDSTAGGIVNAYQVTDTFVRKSGTDQTITYSGVSQMTLSTSTVFDSVAVDSTPAGMSLSVLSNGGNDLINFGGNIGGNIRGPVSIDGGAGTDSLTITNVLDDTPSTQTLTSSTFVDGNTLTYTACEQLTVNCGPGGTSLAVNSVTVRTTVNGGNGDDRFTVGGGDIDANIPISTSAAPALVINGGGGSDAIRFDDFHGPNVDGYIFQRTAGIDQLDKTDAGIHRWVSWGGIEAAALDASNAPTPGTAMSGIAVSDIATPLRINGNAGNDWVQIFDAQSPVTVNTGLGGTDRMDVNFDFDAQPLTVIVDQSDDIETLNVHAPAVLRITDDAVLTKTRLTATPANPTISGVLDLFGGAFLSRAGGPTLAQLRNQIVTGRNGGTWDGSGPSGAIRSSLAASSSLSDGVGYGFGSEIVPTSIGPFTIAPGDTLLRYALDGDADLDGRVNLNDFNRLAASFGQPNRVWVDGDANYDGLVNLNDFNALAGNFGQALAATTSGHRPGSAAAPDEDLGLRLLELS